MAVKKPADKKAKIAQRKFGVYKQDKEMQGLVDILKSIDISGERFVKSTNTNVEKFVQLINKVMDQSSYHAHVLTKLESIVSKLPDEFEALRKDVNNQLEKIVLHYEIKRKEK